MHFAHFLSFSEIGKNYYKFVDAIVEKVDFAKNVTKIAYSQCLLDKNWFVIIFQINTKMWWTNSI
jgi:hypothetical protein